MKESVMFMSVTGLIQGEVDRKGPTTPQDLSFFGAWLSDDAVFVLIFMMGCWASFLGELISCMFSGATTDRLFFSFGGRGGLTSLLAFLSLLNPSLEFTMSYFLIPIPLTMTALKCLLLNIALDYFIDGGKRHPWALAIGNVMAYGAGAFFFFSKLK